MDALKSCTITTKGGPKPFEEVVKSAKIVGIYFSAHWCPPCRGFTPHLAQLYKSLEGQGFEVIFVSSDRDQKSFDEYYGEMPWTAIPFEDREAKQKLAEAFEVRGIPMLVLLKPDGTLVTKEGRGKAMEDGGIKNLLA